jgi:hypothetical protein
MTDSGQRTFSGNLFERNKNCDADINEALKKENAPRGATVKNMYRLKALRLECDPLLPHSGQRPPLSFSPIKYVFRS